MIQKLRWKFVLITTFLSFTIISVVMFLSFTSVNSELRKEDENVLHYMMEVKQTSYGIFSEMELEYINNPYLMLEVTKGGLVSDIHSNYFGAITEKNEKELLGIVADTLNAKENIGILQDKSLRYFKKKNVNGWDMVYINISAEISMLKGLLKNMTFINMGSCTGIFFLSIALATWMTKPAEKAWEQQRQFVADASHELKTPLTVILSNTDMLLKNSDKSDEPTQRRLSNIRAESVRMRGLVEDLLFLSRSDSGASKIHMEQISLSDTLMDSILIFEPLAFEKSKKLQYRLVPNLTILADENRIKQLFSILLDNALKYSDEKGQIWVELECNTAKTIQIMVASSGDTMTTEQCKLIFERFYRTDPAREHNGGYGLGLSIASSIVKELEGKIWCTSQNGINSFYVQLPVAKRDVLEEIKPMEN